LSEDINTAIENAFSIQREAARLGFDWDDAAPVIDKAREEIDELMEAIQQQDIDSVKREFGDLLFVMVNLSRHLNVSLASSIALTNAKFQQRFEHVKCRALETGTEMKKSNVDVLERFWIEAKKAE